MEEILLNKSDKKIILLGNEAIVRGAVEAGVNFVSTYPGTPASEIGDTFYRIAKETGIYFEYSTNEKTALEAAIGASFSGLKSLVAMKSFGLNVASDSLLPLCYTGTKGPMVIVVGDDPSCWSSAQSEQDSRAYCYLAHLPALQPADPQECKDFTKLAFKISEKFKIPVMIRTTTRVAHQRMPVKLEKLKIENFPGGEFIKEPKKFVTMPPRVLEMKKELLEKIEKIREFSEKSSLNQIKKIKKNSSLFNFGIITSGISYLYVTEAQKELNLNFPVLKLGFFYPLPEKKIKNFIKDLKKVLIVEELENYLEKEVERLAKDVNSRVQIFGKNLLPRVGELRPEIIVSALTIISGKKYQLKYSASKLKTKHLPRFCPGCPHWQIFTKIKKLAPQNSIFGGDIGCYMIASLAPHNLYDYLSCMGSSIGIGHGISRSVKHQKTIIFIGDSTFFHAGIPALINTVFNKSDPLIIILDNGTTAMTGRQPYPGSAVRIDSQYQYEWEGYLPSQVTPEKPIKIEEIVLACGVKNLKIVDPFKADQIEQAFKEFLPKKEVSVIIVRGMCALLAKSLK